MQEQRLVKSIMLLGEPSYVCQNHI